MQSEILALLQTKKGSGSESLESCNRKRGHENGGLKKALGSG